MTKPMSKQPEFPNVVAFCDAITAAKKAASDAAFAETFGDVQNKIGLLTREQIYRNAYPEWMWDDYAI